ncbi:hypothetical protein [uncultured Jatrophihabitans sp.]|uniref:hypothetical protein n=1 Tax=uncultured Jatrophihabitans sp. TaxID=1610747 RepID=UPI0035CC82AE
MTTDEDDQLRVRPQRWSRSRRTHAPVVVPLVLSLLVQAVAVVTAVALGAPLAAVLGVAAVSVVLTGIVARRTVSSLVAGAGLRVAQPYEPGEQVRVFVPALDSVEDAEIVRVGPANTTLRTSSGVVLVPNADMLRGGARS